MIPCPLCPPPGELLRHMAKELTTLKKQLAGEGEGDSPAGAPGVNVERAKVQQIAPAAVEVVSARG